MGSPPMIDGAFARWLASRAGQALMDLRAEMGFADAGRVAGRPGTRSRTT